MDEYFTLDLVLRRLKMHYKFSETMKARELTVDKLITLPEAQLYSTCKSLGMVETEKALLVDELKYLNIVLGRRVVADT
jgi:hypothetical protein